MKRKALSHNTKGKFETKKSLIFRRKWQFALIAAFSLLAVFGGRNLTLKSAAEESATVAQTASAVQFCNTTPISITGILSSGKANPYPSNIEVSGLSGVVSSVSVTINNVQHAWGRDIDILLVSPDGRKFLMMSDVGQGNGLDNPATLTFTDSAAALVTNQFGQIASGSYKPTNHNDGLNTDNFDAPAPGAPYPNPAPTGSATFASVFNGANPNGTWSLYVMDDASSNSGAISGGWCLDITTGAPQSGQFQFGLSAFNANANSTATVTVTRANGMAGAATVDYATSGGSATGGASCTAGVDYINANGTLSFADGELSKTFNVQLCPDAGSEPTETVNLNLSNPTGGATIGSPASVPLTINPAISPSAEFCNSIPIEISANGGTAGAAYPYPSNISVSGMSGAVSSVKLTLNGIQHTNGSEIDILMVSPTGQKFIVMSDVGGGLGFNAPATITLSDFALSGLPTNSLEIASGNYKPTNSEAGDGFPAPAPASPYGNPAPAGADTFASVFNGFDPNGTWSLYVYDDFVGDSGTIAGGWCLSISTTILQSPGQIQFGTTNYSANEGETANVVVTRSSGSSGAVTIDYATSNGSATGGASCGNGVDFIHQSGTVSFPDGVQSRTIPIQMCLDADNDPNETFNVALSNPTGGATIGANNTASVRIIHIDQSIVRLDGARNSAEEGTTQTIQVVRNFNQIGTATVDFATSNGDATGGAACTEGIDFIHKSGTITFPPGAVTRSFTITTCPDSVTEVVENANITLSNAVGAQLSEPNQAVLNIYESTWEKQATFPTGQTLEDVHMISATEGWAVGGFGLIIHTTDGGVTWERQASGTFEALRAVHFHDAQNGWASGNVDLYTSDGGRTWQHGYRQIPGVGTVYQMDFADRNRGFSTGNAERAIMKTTDGGRNWQRQDMPIRIGLVEFFDALNGIASSFEGVLVTTDGGQNWTQRPNATGADEWFDTNHGWRTDNSEFVGGVIRQKIEYTINGGVTWTRGTVPEGTYVSRIFFVDTQNGWAVGTKENIIRTTDGGRTWQTQRGGLNSPRRFNSLLRDIHMFDTLHGIAVGNTGLVYTTGDGGLTWTARQSGSGYKVHKIVATDAGHAWAALEDGEILKTTDGGRFWSRQKAYVGGSPQDALIAGIAFPNEQNGWACIRGRIGTPGIPSVIRTTNSGDDWQDVNNAPAHNCWAIDTFDGNTIVSVGFEGGGAPIVRSTDGGQTWTYTVYPNSSIIRDVDMVSPNVGFMAAGAQLLKSTDGFASWTLLQFGGSWFDVSFVDENNGWVLRANDNGFVELWHTSNGGQTWDIKSMPDAVSVHAVNAQTAWVVEHDYDVLTMQYDDATYALRTTDGGQTFPTRELISLNNISTAVFFVDADNGWVGGIRQEFPSLTIEGAEIYRRGTLGVNSSKTPYDFDGDGKADVSVYREGVWHLQQSANGYTSVQFGLAADKIAAADYDGDGKTDIAVFRDGTWYVMQSANSQVSISQFGLTGDIPQTGDFDGDGKSDLAVFRPSNRTWYLQMSRNGFSATEFGFSDDKPVAGDYDGDGKADIAVYRASEGIWHLLRSRDGYTSVRFGISTDLPVPSDFDGDGKADVAVYRDGVWYIRQSRDGVLISQFGLANDKPVPADYDGDGKADLAVYREGIWHLQRSTMGYMSQQFGLAGDKPIPNAFVP
jgi:photosystem II stability/assembly factor-like uncharacterized protein/subtilisin-like proprotein convertase family protein